MVEYGKAELELAQILEAKYGAAFPNFRWLEVAAAVIQLMKNLLPLPYPGDQAAVEEYIKKLAPSIATIVVTVYSQLIGASSV